MYGRWVSWLWLLRPHPSCGTVQHRPGRRGECWAIWQWRMWPGGRHRWPCRRQFGASQANRTKKLFNELRYYQSTILHASYDSFSQTWQLINNYIHVAIIHCWRSPTQRNAIIHCISNSTQRNNTLLKISNSMQRNNTLLKISNSFLCSVGACEQGYLSHRVTTHHPHATHQA